ncbi:ribokinase [Mariniphaga sediminis]|uniref:ribokinase n=1 Tax=Mariniphaga sediminis TaxID=1628158 RepID=UPI0035659E79
MDKILVIGSSNADLIATMEQFPVAGETIEGVSFQQAMGGKGANQALAAHRAGGDVTFITSLGNDVNGQNAFQYYKNEGLDVSLSLLTDNEPTGTAMIWVDKKGENSIVIIPGANKELTPEYIIAVEEKIANADFIVLQMEIPYETVKTICEIAVKKGKKILLNVAPACHLDDDILKAVHVLVVNETEAEIISGEKMEELGEEAIVNKLLIMGVQNVVLTLGKEGSLFKNKEEQLKIPAFKVDTIDSTAAGDTICGAMVAELSKGHRMKEALEFATAAAAICVTRMGAQPSIPSEKEVRKFLNHRKQEIN